MIYIIGLLRKGFKADGEILRYRLLDTLSESHMMVDYLQMRRILLNTNLQIVNADMHNNKIRLKDWIHNITVRLTGDIVSDLTDEYSKQLMSADNRCCWIYLGKVDDKYRVSNYNGVTREMSLEELKYYIKAKDIANCDLLGQEEIKGIDTHDIVKNEEFKKSIAIKYESFIAKALMLGHGDQSFVYKIDNGEVILRWHIGSSKNILIAPFITAVMPGAFTNKYINSLELNEGLKIIGSRAFDQKGQNDTLGDVEIPSTVQLVGPRAFKNNTRLLDRNGMLSIHRFRLRNDKTIVLSQS